jgi:hypothetical protein
MGVNTSPEPASNIIVSLAEDLGVSGIIVLALFHPLPAAIIAAVALVLGVITVIFIMSRIRRYWRRWQARRAARRSRLVQPL